jgi:hypothetical protein
MPIDGGLLCNVEPRKKKKKNFLEPNDKFITQTQTIASDINCL